MRLSSHARLLASVTALLWPQVAAMQLNACPLGGNCIGGGSIGFGVYVLGVLFPAAQIVFIAAAVLYFTYYGVQLIFGNGSGEAQSEAKNAYTYGITGAAAVSAAVLIVQAVGSQARFTLVNQDPVFVGLDNFILYFRLIAAVIMTGLITYLGLHLIVSQGDEGKMEEARKKFFYAVIGVGVMLLANALVEAFLPGRGSEILAVETVGIINFILELIGALAVLSFIVAGFFLVISTDEALKDRAKTIMLTTVITLIVVLLSYIIVNYFVLLTFAGEPTP